MSKTVILGTAGHIDHGKSSLVRVLTGIDPDRLKEEKERGITIELGFARLSLPSGTLAGIVDVPGHERFVRTMVAGAAGVDIVLLVVAADEGVMPQTREHLDICRLLAVRHGIVVLNKCDKADGEWMDLQEEEIRTLVRGTFLEGAPIVRVSAATGQGLPDLVAALDRIAAGIPGKDSSDLFRLPVDRSFSMKGFGTVVTGTLIGGTVATGEEVAILPGGTVAKVRGLQVHGGPVERSTAGTRTAVNLQGVEKESAPRGSVLCRPGTFTPTKSAEVFVEYLPLVPKPLRHRGQVSFHAGTFSCVGRILLYGQAEIPPGGSGYGRVLLSEETVLSGGDRFILRGFSPLANFGYTIGGGAILHPTPPARRGAGKTLPAVLPRLRSEDPAERVLATVEDAAAAGATPGDVAVVSGIGAERTREIVKGLAAGGRITEVSAAGKMWARSAISSASSLCSQALTQLHDRNPERGGFPREEIASLFSTPPDPGFLSLALEGNASISRLGELHFLSARKPKAVDLGSPLAQKVAEVIRAAGDTARGRTELLEAVKGISSDPRAVEKVVEGLARAGKIVRVKELLFDGAALRGIEERIVAFLAKRGEITVPEFKEMTGLSRKYIIPLLEHFDATKVTLRVGDKRVLRKK
ncbi:MAG: selenocysteine-specific translation elongation factor [Deltaproteobacteria bacterium CG2_30_66_27]|nr:MAG: selenocysteine-specific translation elongation factor [Deltaproteobacteria bacterium CG2_30_66_27]